MRHRLLMAVLIGVVGTLGCIAYINAATNNSPRPAIYRAAVMCALEEQHVDYRDVEGDGCAPSSAAEPMPDRCGCWPPQQCLAGSNAASAGSPIHYGSAGWDQGSPAR